MPSFIFFKKTYLVDCPEYSDKVSPDTIPTHVNFKQNLHMNIESVCNEHSQHETQAASHTVTIQHLSDRGSHTMP